MTEAAEKPKRKNKPKSLDSRFALSHTLFLVFAAAPGIVFFWVLPGNVLSPVESAYLSPLCVTLLLLAIPFADYKSTRQLQLIPPGQEHARSRFAFLVTLAMIAVLIFAPQAFIEFGITLTIFSPFVLVIIFVLTTGYLLTQKFHQIVCTQNFVKRHLLITGYVSVFAITAVFGFLAMLNELKQSHYIGSRNYVLIKDTPALEEWYYIDLYACNLIIFDCEKVYSAPTQFPGFYGSEDDIVLEVGDRDNVLVILNGEIVFDSSEDNEQ
ncbi:MAG: hypothetical protein KC546_16125 [Anaerolineae bacterium]|nr:hypothetical protein [Anaerolineae bacterium]MCA9895013.1 hypothetical protein [Anaerolineae bacterium]